MADAVAKLKHTASLHNDRVIEYQIPTMECGEVWDAPAEHYGQQAEVQFIDQVEVKGLLGDAGTDDDDIPAAGETPGPEDGWRDLVDEGCPRPPVRGVGRGAVSDHNHRDAN